MAREEAKIRVRLDTSQAQADLRALRTDVESAAGRVGDRIRESVGFGMRSIGLGNAPGTVMSTLRGATESGFGDVAGEALGPYAGMLERFVFGDLSADARASQRAREETMDAFATVAGMRGSIPQEARTYFAQVKALHMQSETGRQLFRSDKEFFGAGPGELIDRFVDKLAPIIDRGFLGLGAYLASHVYQAVR